MRTTSPSPIQFWSKIEAQALAGCILSFTYIHTGHREALTGIFTDVETIFQQIESHRTRTIRLKMLDFEQKQEQHVCPGYVFWEIPEWSEVFELARAAEAWVVGMSTWCREKYIESAEEPTETLLVRGKFWVSWLQIFIRVFDIYEARSKAESHVGILSYF